MNLVTWYSLTFLSSTLTLICPDSILGHCFVQSNSALFRWCLDCLHDNQTESTTYRIQLEMFCNIMPSTRRTLAPSLTDTQHQLWPILGNTVKRWPPAIPMETICWKSCLSKLTAVVAEWVECYDDVGMMVMKMEMMVMIAVVAMSDWWWTTAIYRSMMSFATYWY